MKKKRQLFQVVGGTLEWKEDSFPNIDCTNALQYSIAKWKFIVEWLRKWKQPLRDGGASTCALCHVYNDGMQDAPCLGCPISELTGSAQCRNTPYRLYAITSVNENLTYLTELVALTELNFLRALQQGQPRE